MSHHGACLHVFPYLTSSPGLISCTALTSATVPLYVTITLGLQLWFIRATLEPKKRCPDICTFNYNIYYNNIQYNSNICFINFMGGFWILTGLLWKYSRTQMWQLLIFNGEAITVHLWCRHGEKSFLLLHSKHKAACLYDLYKNGQVTDIIKPVCKLRTRKVMNKNHQQRKRASARERGERCQTLLKPRTGFKWLNTSLSIKCL